MPESQPSNIVSATAGGDDYWRRAIERMTELTKEGKMKWDVVVTGDAIMSSSLEVFAAYDARYDNKIVRFLETEPAPNSLVGTTERFASHSALSSMISTPLGVSTRRRRSEYSLLLIDVNGVPLFAFPQSSNLIELLAAIKNQIADPEGFVEALFAAA